VSRPHAFPAGLLLPVPAVTSLLDSPHVTSAGLAERLQRVGRHSVQSAAVFSAAGIAGAVVAVWLFGGGSRAAGLLVACLAVLAWLRSYRLGGQLAGAIDRERRQSDLHLATVEALALAIDAKDKTTASHIRRVQYYAQALARAEGLSDDEVQGVGIAALLHDIGKLAVPEHILSKPGRLTEEEFGKIHIHPQVGFEIVEHVPFPFPVALLVLCHHERWDGTGYPLGLEREDIPLGARVLAVADYFDSLTRDRPYNKRLPREVATMLLKQEAGRALDPSLVARFVEMLPRLSEFVAAAVEAARAPLPEPSTQVSGANLASRLFKTGAPSAFDNIARAHQEVYALYEIAQSIGSSLDVADTMTVIATKLSRLVPFSSCALFVQDDDRQLRCRFSTGVDADVVQRTTLPAGHGLTGWVTRKHRPAGSGRPSGDFETVDLAPPSESLRSALACPLVSGDQVIGALCVYHVEAGFYGREHRRLLGRIAGQIAVAVANSLMFQQTRQESLSDPLTGLPNTRFMLSYLDRELSRAERLDRPLAILVLDLDDFKAINDTRGHHTGDRALQEVARALRATIRPYDICVRYAGDEFVVVLPDCGEEEAEAKRAELQRAVDDIAFTDSNNEPLRLRVSAGSAVFPDDGETYESLLATADGRMYHDKKSRKPAPEARAAGTASARLENTVPAIPVAHGRVN